MADRVVYVEREKKRGCLSGCGSAVVLLGIIFGCVIVGVMVIGSKARRDVQNHVPSSSAPARAPAAQAVHTGDAVVIHLPGADYGPWLATSEDAWNEMIDAQNSKSGELMGRLMEQGRVIRVPNGTPGVVVKTSFLSLLVRLTEGDARGQEGWIQREFVKPAGAAQ